MSTISELHASAETRQRFVLFVAGEEANSVIARKNLQQICDEYLPDRHDIECVDVFVDYQAALDNNVLLTPTLIRIEPRPRVSVLGNLSETDRVVAALELRKPESATD